ncbi:MAG: endonuclease/exonuclease/phosphatase family protein [Cellulosilyticaceae bacterium]
MTFNVRADNVFDIHNRWNNRSNIVYNLLNKYACDVVGLQEVTDKMYKDLSGNLQNYEIIGVGRTKHYFNEKNNLLINKEYKIIEDETFWLSKTPTKKGSSIWYSLFPRICTTAVVEVPNTGKIRIYNTHLDCLVPYAREYGLKKIGSYIEKTYESEKLPCILMGDFNATPNSKLIKEFSGGLYTSKRFIAVQEQKKGLYDQATMGMFKDKEKGMHIDYIFVSEEFKIEDVEVVKFNDQGKFPSDHYPVMAKLTL